MMATQLSLNDSPGCLQLKQVESSESVLTSNAQAILLLHGWGSGSWIWREIADELAKEYQVYLLDLPGYGANKTIQVEKIEQFLSLFDRDIAPLLPGRFVLLGWSLGGVLATLLASKYPARVRGLFAIATSPEFLASSRWPDGMSSEDFNQFSHLLKRDPVKLQSRFNLLQAKGGAEPKATIKWLADGQRENRVAPAVLNDGLKWLAETSLLDYWKGLPMPVFHSFGRGDGIVSVSNAAAILQRFPLHAVRVYERSGHLPFVDQMQQWLTDFRRDLDSPRFYEAAGATIDKPAVIKAFDRAAPRYDLLASFQRKVAARLVDGIDNSLSGGGLIVDLGAGTGFIASAFGDANPARLIQLDISRRMLEQARTQRGVCAVAGSRGDFIQGDLDALPFAPQSVDCFVSSLSMQWSTDPVELFSSAHRALKKKGQIYFATLLPGSLREVAQASACLEGAPHVHDFCDEKELLQSAEQAGFRLAEWREEIFVERFGEPVDLLKSINGIGAGNHRVDRSVNMMGKASYRKLLSALSSLRDCSGEIPLTYRVIFARFVK